MNVYVGMSVWYYAPRGSEHWKDSPLAATVSKVFTDGVANMSIILPGGDVMQHPPQKIQRLDTPNQDGGFYVINPHSAPLSKKPTRMAAKAPAVKKEGGAKKTVRA